MKKVEKTTGPFMYDLNQIPCDYTVEVTNRFKGLDLIDRVPEKLWIEVHDIVQERGIKTISKNKKYKKAKYLSEEALQIAEKRREAKGKGERKDTPIWMQSSKEEQGEIRKPSSVISAKKEDSNRIIKTRDLFKKNQRYLGNISCKVGHNKGQKWYGPNRSRRY